jgi:Flp pilus assembly protein TadD
MPTPRPTGERHLDKASGISSAVMHSLDELLAAWQADPSAEATLALSECLTDESLGASGRDVLVHAVAQSAQSSHAADWRVMKAVGRMHLRAGNLADAQTFLVAASRANTRDPGPFRWLGEVLLRRGDAKRAKRAFAHARKLDPADTQCTIWCARAAVFVPLQESLGTAAVAAEVNRFLPQVDTGSIPGQRMDASDEAPPGEDDSPPVPTVSPRSDQPREPSGAEPWLFDEALTLVAPSTESQVGYGSLDPEVTPVQAPSSLPPFSPVRRTGTETAPARESSTLSPAFLLEHLARVGLFDPTLAWGKTRAKHRRRRWWITGAAGLILSLALGAGLYIQRSYSKRAKLSQSMADESARLLDSVRPEHQLASDPLLLKAQELDPGNDRAARLWLKNRVLASLFRSSPTAGLDAALARARELGASDRDLAYASIGSLLAQRDLAGALDAAVRWHQEADDDPMFQLVTGAALAQAGDPGAAKRFRAALSLSPRLTHAKVSLAASLLFDQGAEVTRSAVTAAANTPGDERVAQALQSLLVVLTRDAKAPPPPGAALEDVPRLPRPLAAVPFMVQTLRHLAAGESHRVRATLEAALAVELTPAQNLELARLALRAGQLGLARRLTSRALIESPAHPRAIELGAYQSALSGDLESAEQAMKPLDRARPMTVCLAAIAAYERGDPAALGPLTDALAREARSTPVLGALAMAQPVLLGSSLMDADALRGLGLSGAHWSQLLAADAALDTGLFELAGELSSTWSEETRGQSPFCLRRARLERYRDRPGEALRLSAAALEQATLTDRLALEHVLALSETGDASTALDFALAHSPVTGAGPWLVVFALGRAGRGPEARELAKKLPLPLEASVPLRIAVARALATTKDERALAYLTSQLKLLPRHPDLRRATADLNR